MIEYCESNKKQNIFSFDLIMACSIAITSTFQAIYAKKPFLTILVVVYWLFLLVVLFGKTKPAYLLCKKLYPDHRGYQIVPYGFSGIVLDHEEEKIYFGEKGFFSCPLSVKYNDVTQSKYSSSRQDCIEVQVGKSGKYLFLYKYKENAQKALIKFFIDNSGNFTACNERNVCMPE